jgi:ABC-2 type transport system ATP-binding protein
MSAIAVSGLRKTYGAFEALAGVDLEIPGGEVFALLGPNGAGKTTLVEILEGYRDRSAGEVSVLGTDPRVGGAAWKERLGIVLQGTAIFEALTVEELVGHFGGFYPSPRPVGEVIELVGLAEKRGERCSRLSGGQKRRVDLALGIIGDPELIFLDEPTTGFDPAARRQAWDVVRGFTALGKTVLLTTHYLDEAEQLATRVGVIIRGRLAALGTPAEIGGRATGDAIVSFRREGRLRESLVPELGTLTEAGGTIAIRTDAPTAAVSALAEWARGHGVDELPGLAVTRPSLEDIYLEMVAAAATAMEETR